MRRAPGVAGPNAFAQALRHNLQGDPFLTSWQQWAHIAAVHGSYSSTLAADAVPVASDQVQNISLSAAPSVNDLLVIGSFSTTLASAASAGASTVSMNAAPPVGLLLQFGNILGTFGGEAAVLDVTGTGPYAVTLSTGLAYDQASGATVTGLPPAYPVSAVSGTGPYTATIMALQSPWPSGTGVVALASVDAYLDQSVGIDRNSDGTPTTRQLTARIRYLGWYTPQVGDYVLVGRSNMSNGGGSDRVVLGTLA